MPDMESTEHGSLLTPKGKLLMMRIFFAIKMEFSEERKTLPSEILNIPIMISKFGLAIKSAFKKIYFTDGLYSVLRRKITDLIANFKG